MKELILKRFTVQYNDITFHTKKRRQEYTCRNLLSVIKFVAYVIVTSRVVLLTSSTQEGVNIALALILYFTR